MGGRGEGSGPHHTMTAYRYEAARQDGGLVAGMIEAETAAQVGAVLAERGLYPIAVAEWRGEERRPAASRRDLAIAFRGIAALVGAWVREDRSDELKSALARFSRD